MFCASWAICMVALREASARRCTSSVTTAKPRPASPAMAACMDAFRASTWVRSEIELMTVTICEISCERSPRRFTRFSISPMDSRMPPISPTVVVTDFSAASVVDVACAAAVRDCSASCATCCIRPDVCAMSRVISSTAWRSSCTCSDRTWALVLTRAVESATWLATAATLVKALDVASANMLTESATVPTKSEVTSARTVKLRCDSSNMVRSRATTESLSCPFSISALRSVPMRSSSSLLKVSPRSWSSSPVLTVERTSSSPAATCCTRVDKSLTGRVMVRTKKKPARPASASTPSDTSSVRRRVCRCSSSALARASASSISAKTAKRTPYRFSGP